MKLLNRTLLGFLIYSVALLLIVTPILYLVINNIIINNVDNTLQIHKKEIQTHLENLPSDEAVRQWEDLDGEIIVKPLDGAPVEEKVFTIDDNRVLTGSITIKGKLYSIRAQLSLVESEDLISALVLTQVLVLITLIAGMLIINWWNSKTVWKPFYNTLQQFRSFKIEKNSEIDLQPSSIAEFNDLNAAIRELTRRDHEAFVSQREFTENAAHEMQTPLAIVQSKLDMLLQTQPTIEQAPLLGSLFDATARLNRLNKSLLLLTKIDNRQFHETEPVDLHVATKRLAEGTNIVIRSEGLMVTINPGLVDILLSNLISNALRYTSNSSGIVVDIKDQTWTISNPGPRLPIPAEKMFQRFQKGSSNKESLGLGLAIAKKISDTNDLDLSYRYANSTHHFTITFPESKISTKSLS